MNTDLTIGEMVAAHEASLSAATANRDWSAVQVEARHLLALDGLAARFGADAAYQPALIGHRVVVAR